MCRRAFVCYMSIPVVYSIKSVEKQYPTGEDPILVLCSDKKEYVCKYARTTGAAYKLACEMIGSLLANTWRLTTPTTAFVNIRPVHWHKAGPEGTLAYGSQRMESVIDINPTTIESIHPSDKAFLGLLRIALFDFWIANEDRNANNANLLYSLEYETLVSIDYGCIFNTATYNYPLSQLTSTDTILASNLFHFLYNGQQIDFDDIEKYFRQCIVRSKQAATKILSCLPARWNVPVEIVREKIIQLSSPRWVNAVWDNFKECLNENTQQQ